MDDLDKHLDRLKKRCDDITVRDTEKRNKAWGRLKEEAPEMADFLNRLNQTFGRPKTIQIWLREERIF